MPRASVSRNHLTAPPQLNITPIACQPPFAWQNVWAAPAGSYSGLSIEVKTTPLVPRLTLITPGFTAPVPTAAAAWSPPPPMIGMPSGSEVPAVSADTTNDSVQLGKRLG